MPESDIPTPPVLYKYYAFNEWTQSIFERNEIFLQSPDCFNDPFDSKIFTTYEGTEEERVSRLIELGQKGPAKGKTKEALRSQAWEKVQTGLDLSLIFSTMKRSVERMRKRIGIFCMTSKRDNILMWSHYADAHTGFCLEFVTQKLFWKALFPVNYPPEGQGRPRLNLIESPNPDDIVNALLTKSKEWEYETEWRIVDHENGPGIQIYPPEALTGVILGCRISPQNRLRIMQWCRARNPRPAVYWAEEKEREFGLDMIPIPYEDTAK